MGSNPTPVAYFLEKRERKERFLRTIEKIIRYNNG
jgi:hypothetical protein